MKHVFLFLVSLVFSASLLADKISEPEQITVTTTSTPILLPNTERIGYLYIRNTGATDCDVSFSRTAVLARGILLKAGESLPVDLKAHTGAISAITAAGTTTIRISERSR